MARFSLLYNPFAKIIKAVAFIIFVLFLLTFLSSCQKAAKLQVQMLNKNWQISGDSITLQSLTIPVEVHLALADAGHIPDPFKAGVEKDLQWVSRQQWVWES